MKRALGLGLGLLGVLVIGAIFFLLPAPRPVSESEVDGQLSPWVHPAGHGLSFAEYAPKKYLLLPEAPFVPLKEQTAFTLDPARFVSEMGASNFTEAQLRYFSKPQHAGAALRGWGELPYPPVHEVLAPVPASPPFSELALSDPGFQLELDRQSGFELTRNEGLELLQNGEALPKMKEIAARAQKFLFLNFLIVSCDSSTEELLSILGAKAASGVDVRLLVNEKYAFFSQGCLNRLRAEKIDVAKSKTHASYLLNDQGEVVIGSENLARMNFRSNGFNFLDRDLMLALRGPVATDALTDFLRAWDRASGGERGTSEYLPVIGERIQAEVRSGARGEPHYTDWLKQPRGLCRFTAQRAEEGVTGISSLWLSLIRSARKQVFFSGVRFGESPVLEALHRRSKEGLNVQFLGNGQVGGNGELTMILDEWIERLLMHHHRILAGALSAIRNSDARNKAEHFFTLANQVVSPHFEVWTYFNFLHYKAWLIDRTGLWIGSANPERESIDESGEAGVFCLDPELTDRFAHQTAIDLENSVPLARISEKHR